MALPGIKQVLAINAGSSTIKFALYSLGATLHREFYGAIDDIGGPNSHFTVHGAATDMLERRFPIPERVTATNVLVEWLLARLPSTSLEAVVHRVVFGNPENLDTQLVSSALLKAMYAAATNDPEHLPQEIQLIELLRQKFPHTQHIVCFDSKFHETMPRIARMLPLPLQYYAAGVRRFGFHGISCAYLMRKLQELDLQQATKGKVLIAHLGGGSSVTAVSNGRSCDTSMGMTPASGMMMGKRSGDLDPGVAWHFARTPFMSAAQFNHMVNHSSGLLGVSGFSDDMRVLLAREAADIHVHEAIELYCYLARKTICAMAGAIDGMETLIFSGGIGEYCADVRLRICHGLSHLGVVLDTDKNLVQDDIISMQGAAVTVRVMHTEEEWMLAEEARRLMAHQAASPSREATYD